MKYYLVYKIAIFTMNAEDILVFHELWSKSMEKKIKKIDANKIIFEKFYAFINSWKKLERILAFLLLAFIYIKFFSFGYYVDSIFRIFFIICLFANTLCYLLLEFDRSLFKSKKNIDRLILKKKYCYDMMEHISEFFLNCNYDENNQMKIEKCENLKIFITDSHNRIKSV